LIGRYCNAVDAEIPSRGDPEISAAAYIEQALEIGPN
jgi:hypothetical protein